MTAKSRIYAAIGQINLIAVIDAQAVMHDVRRYARQRKMEMDREKVGTQQKALAINLDAGKYGTFAEIDAE